MSFYSYKNANMEVSPGTVSANECMSGLNERVCVQLKRVFDSCMQQEQIDDLRVTINCVEPVLNDCGCGCGCGHGHHNRPYGCETDRPQPETIPGPQEPWTFVSCRAASNEASMKNLVIDRLCDRPQFARVRAALEMPLEILFTDACCNEWIGRAVITVNKDVLLCIPDDSIVPFTMENMVSAVGVTGTYLGNNRFEITVCVTIILKVLAKVELLIPTYGYCPIPPCEEYAENVCDEFFSLPLYPQAICSTTGTGNGTGGACCGTAGACCTTGTGTCTPRCPR